MRSDTRLATLIGGAAWPGLGAYFLAGVWLSHTAALIIAVLAGALGGGFILLGFILGWDDPR